MAHNSPRLKLIRVGLFLTTCLPMLLFGLVFFNQSNVVRADTIDQEQTPTVISMDITDFFSDDPAKREKVVTEMLSVGLTMEGIEILEQQANQSTESLPFANSSNAWMYCLQGQTATAWFRYGPASAADSRFYGTTTFPNNGWAICQEPAGCVGMDFSAPGPWSVSRHQVNGMGVYHTSTYCGSG